MVQIHQQVQDSFQLDIYQVQYYERFLDKKVAFVCMDLSHL